MSAELTPLPFQLRSLVITYPLALAISLRVALTVTAAWLLSMRPPLITPGVRIQYLHQQPLFDLWVGPWQRFDAFWYTLIATRGYNTTDGSTVFFPLYPLLSRGVTVLLGGHIVLAALLVSNVFFALGAIGLYNLVLQRFNSRAALYSLLCLCVYPTAVFLLAPYTESLFLATTIFAFMAMDRDKPALAAFFGILAACTRLQGVLISIPMLIIACQRYRHGHGRWTDIVLGFLPIVATAAFAAYTQVFLHAAFITHVYSHQVHQTLSMPWTVLSGYWNALSVHHFQIFSYATGNWVELLNIVLAVGTLAVVAPFRRLIGTPMWAYSLATWGATLCIPQGTARHMITIFPALIIAAVAMTYHKRWAPKLVLALGAPIMLFITGEFVSWSFVG